jgi:hypothetical protein
MKRSIALFFALLFAFVACKKKSNVSNTPSISLASMTPDSIKQGSGEDTVYIKFNLTDGDADLGNRDPTSTEYDIYIKDARNDTFQGYFFPEIASAIEDPAKGLTGTCVFKMLGALIYSRQDSIHILHGDTTHFQLYIKDRAGHNSDTITTKDLRILP